ncbi:MAG TPA: acyl-CoA dehydrogenase family protein, partial [Flavipsychrobacter sp.]|nr:acyl-CoA dehydrogenase family protein [Flavipsychrobacter sp.]
METQHTALLKGGNFLVQVSDPANTFTPEDFSEEQKLVAQTCREFLDKEVIPHLLDLDKQEPGLMQSLLEKAGELGFLG